MADNEKVVQGAVWLAVCLGWHLAELFDSKDLPGPPERQQAEPLPPHLPGLGEMSPHEKACALAAHASAVLISLGAALETEMPEATDVLTALGVASHERDDVREAVLRLYLDIRNRLAGRDVAAATGFGLGRMLADTALLPASDDPKVLGERFDTYRLANAFAWLGDLDARLPAHSAAAVRASLREWERWISARRGPDGSIDPSMVDEIAIRSLRRQGELWRRLLTGEQAADQLLDGRAYTEAAARLLANGRRIAFHYLWKWSWAILLASGTAAATIWAAVTYAPAGTDRLSAVLVSVAGFLGVSWAGVRATLGRALLTAENAIWEAEVIAAIGKAATITPEVAKTGRRRLTGQRTR
ncbi:MAG TPA: hypothetical protein VN969_13525 [Streptosporangiaceae bacterium]|jgi:hypothetical protein|nr:hypothetical protein [Streptosporangiaceae bacterium]